LIALSQESLAKREQVLALPSQFFRRTWNMKKKSPAKETKVPKVARSNIEAIMHIEQDFLQQRSFCDRISDFVSALAGSLGFVVFHIVVLSAWILINIGMIPGLPVFDRFPFGLLSLVVGIEAIFLSTFVLMSQNRQTHQADHWAHLDLQVGLLAEQETAKILHLVKAICSELGLEKQIQDREIGEMIGKKSVGELAEKLAENLEKTREEQKAPPVNS
jgi:uncharacterized membrane protein